MKTFKDLTIGSKIYRILPKESVVRSVDRDGYVSRSGNIIEEIEVKYLELKKDNDGFVLRINSHEGYSSTSYDFILNESLQSASAFRDKKDNIVFADKSLAWSLARKQILAGIKSEEKRIPDVIKSVEEKIKSIRERYFHVLNGQEWDLTDKSLDAVMEEIGIESSINV